MIENKNPESVPQFRSELPVEIESEQIEKVGLIFSDILEQHGVPYEEAQFGKGGIGLRRGLRAEFISDTDRLRVETREGFSKIEAHIDEKVARSGKNKWQRGDTFIYDPDSDEKLTYRRGHILGYVSSDQRLRPGIEGGQSLSKTGAGGASVNVTPPTAEGVTSTLEVFLKTSDKIIDSSTRPVNRVKNVARNAGKKTVRSLLKLEKVYLDITDSKYKH